MEHRRYIATVHDWAEMRTLLRDERQAFGGTTPFQTPAFLDSFYRSKPQACQEIVLRVAERRTGRSLMILPFLLRRSGGLRRIEAADLGLSDYVAPLVAGDFQPGADDLEEIRHAIAGVLPAADLLSLKKMPAEIAPGVPNPLTHLGSSADMGITTKLFPLKDETGCAPFRKTRYYKEGMRNYRRLVKSHGDVEFRIATNEQEANRQFDALLKHRQARAAELNRDDALLHPHVQRFYRDLFRTGIASGNILFGALYVQDTCIATDLGLIHGDTHHGVLTSMTDGPLRQFSPGTIAFMLILDESVKRGLSHYDLGVGEFAYKDRLKGGALPLYEYHQALSPLGWLGVAEAVLRRQIRLELRRFPALREKATSLRQTLQTLRHRTVVTASVLLDSPVIQGASYSTLSAL